MSTETKTATDQENLPEDFYEMMLSLSFMDAAMRGKLEWISTVMSWFKTDAVMDPFYAELIKAILDIIKDDGPVNDKTVLMQLVAVRRNHDISLLRVSEMCQQCVSQGGHILYYARKVWNRYRAQVASEKLGKKAGELLSTKELDSDFREVREITTELLPPPTVDKTNETDVFEEMLNEAYGMTDSSNIIRTGIRSLDNIVSGIPRNGMIVIAGSTGGGKSVLLSQLALNYLNNHSYPVLMFSLEMNENEVYDRMSANIARCNKRKSKREWQGGVAEVKQMVSAKRLRVYTGSWGIEQIAATVTNIAAVENIGMVVVDYLQLIVPSRREANREEQVNDFARQLKQLAAAVGCPVLTASQLNEQGALRESRAIGHHANIVLKIDHDSTVTDDSVHVDLRVDKSRSSSVGSAAAMWDKSIFRMRDVDEYDRPVSLTGDVLP